MGFSDELKVSGYDLGLHFVKPQKKVFNAPFNTTSLFYSVSEKCKPNSVLYR
jgi:hypothetical protein